MLIEFPIIVESDDGSGLIYEAPATFRLNSIEMIMMNNDESISDLHTNGMIFKIHMGYDKAIRYWFNSIQQTSNGTFLACITKDDKN